MFSLSVGGTHVAASSERLVAVTIMMQTMEIKHCGLLESTLDAMCDYTSCTYSMIHSDGGPDTKLGTAFVLGASGKGRKFLPQVFTIGRAIFIMSKTK